MDMGVFICILKDLWSPTSVGYFESLRTSQVTGRQERAPNDIGGEIKDTLIRFDFFAEKQDVIRGLVDENQRRGGDF